MPCIETFRQQAKQLIRWHRERNDSIGGKVRLLDRYRHLTDADILDQPMPLALAHEIVAVEAGFRDWAALKTDAATKKETQPPLDCVMTLHAAIPVIFVRDVSAAAIYYEEKLGFQIDFLHGKPPFYGSVSRNEACIHLRFVHDTNFADLAEREGSLILAMIGVTNVKVLFQEYEERGVVFAQRLVRQAWGGLDFQVRDPDGNVVSFVEFKHSRAELRSANS